jgi:hypothetical protein
VDASAGVRPWLDHGAAGTKALSGAYAEPWAAYKEM